MLCCLQHVGGGGRTRHRVANGHPGSVHVDRRTKEANLFVRRRLAKGSAHRGSVLLTASRLARWGLQFIFAAATGLCCGCSSIFNAASIALRRFIAAVGLHRSRPVVMNLISTPPSGTAFKMRAANSIWIAPPMIPWAGEISKYTNGAVST